MSKIILVLFLTFLVMFNCESYLIQANNPIILSYFEVKEYSDFNFIISNKLTYIETLIAESPLPLDEFTNSIEFYVSKYGEYKEGKDFIISVNETVELNGNDIRDEEIRPDFDF